MVVFVWLDDGTGTEVFRGEAVWLKAGVGVVVLNGAGLVRLDVGAGIVPLSEDVGTVVALELNGPGKVGDTRSLVEFSAANVDVGVGNNVVLTGRVPLAVGMAGLEPLADTEVGAVV